MMPCNIAKGVLVVGFFRQRVYYVLQVEQMTKEEAMARGHWLQEMSSESLKGHQSAYQVTLLPLTD
jgi:hypothetical protein